MFKLSVCAYMENVVELKLVDFLIHVFGEFTEFLPCTGKCTESIGAKKYTYWKDRICCTYEAVFL